ncbi:MAG: DNA polymerase III subunit gamma/tau C-terminal domain-containing protein, partial [Burkholderiales bacterium]
AIAHGAGSVEVPSTRAMLGAVDQTYLHTILRALAARDGAALIAEANRMAERSLSLEMALQDLATLLHRLALAQAVPQTLADDDPDADVLRELSALFNAEDLQLYYQIAVQARSEIGLAPDEYAGFTMALLRMLAFAPVSDSPVSRSAPAAPATGKLAGTAAAAAQAVAPEPPDVAPPPVAEGASAESWVEIVEQLAITGMARMLAQHCELTRREDTRIELMLPKAHERLLEKAYQERLKAALQKRFGEGVQVSITVGDGSGNSPVAIAQRSRERDQARAIADIEQDPFVRELVENFDARVNESSIKPLQ